MATTSDVKVTAGTGTNVATYDITEDAETKKLQRVVLSTNAGADIDFTAVSPVKIDQTTPGTTNLVAAGQNGTWTVQPGNTANTTAWKVDGSAVTQPVSSATLATAAKQPALGTAGSPSTDVITVQGNASGTPQPVTSASLGFDVATTITRPANVTAYTAGDVLGGALDLGVLGTSAAAVQIVGVQLEADIAAIPAGQTSWTLHLYNVTPPSAIADNGAWDLPSGDRASYLGNVAITTLVDLGSTLYVEINNIFKQLRLSGTHVFAYLQTVGGFTPNANSEVYKLTLHTMVI